MFRVCDVGPVSLYNTVALSFLSVILRNSPVRANHQLFYKTQAKSCFLPQRSQHRIRSTEGHAGTRINAWKLGEQTPRPMIPSARKRESPQKIHSR